MVKWNIAEKHFVSFKCCAILSMMKSVLPTPSHPGWLSFFCAVGEEGRGREVRGKEGESKGGVWRGEQRRREGRDGEGRGQRRRGNGRGKGRSGRRGKGQGSRDPIELPRFLKRRCSH